MDLSWYCIEEAAGAAPFAVELDYCTAHATGITLNGVWQWSSERLGNF